MDLCPLPLCPCPGPAPTLPLTVCTGAWVTVQSLDPEPSQTFQPSVSLGSPLSSDFHVLWSL